MSVSKPCIRTLTCFIVLATFSAGFLTDNVPSLVDRLAAIEANLSSLISNVIQLQAEMKVLQRCTGELCGVHWAVWSEWNHWSVCTGDCTNGQGSREQTRTRTRHCLNGDQSVSLSVCNGVSSQSDKRLCHAVEFYGCLNGENINNTGGQYAVTYNYMDELAQSTCTAALKSASYVAAVRRNCYSGKAPQCSQICSDLGYSCVDELHINHSPKVLKPNTNYQTDEGVVGLRGFRYFSCSYHSGGCGPNYCCCTWH